MTPSKKGYQLCYRRTIHDRHKVYGRYVYTPSITPIARELFRHELEDARKRVVITSNGRYKYTPSKEYVQAFKKHCTPKTNNHDPIENRSNQRNPFKVV